MMSTNLFKRCRYPTCVHTSCNHNHHPNYDEFVRCYHEVRISYMYTYPCIWSPWTYSELKPQPIKIDSHEGLRIPNITNHDLFIMSMKTTIYVIWTVCTSLTLLDLASIFLWNLYCTSPMYWILPNWSCWAVLHVFLHMMVTVTANNWEIGLVILYLVFHALIVAGCVLKKMGILVLDLRLPHCSLWVRT